MKRTYSILLQLSVFFTLMFLSRNIAAAPQSAQEAISEAQAKNQWVFVIFYEKKDSLYKVMNEKIKAFKKDGMDKPLIYRAKISDTKEAEIIAKYRVTGTPMPLLLVFAPNGVVTGGFPQQVSDEQLEKSFPGQTVLNILKIMEEGKLALVMLQNSGTKYNKESTKAAEDFAKIKNLMGAVETIYIDPDDAASKEFITKSTITGPITEATIVMIVPPGRIGGVYKGKTNKDQLLTGIKACSGGSCCHH